MLNTQTFNYANDSRLLIARLFTRANTRKEQHSRDLEWKLSRASICPRDLRKRQREHVPSGKKHRRNSVGSLRRDKAVLKIRFGRAERSGLSCNVWRNGTRITIVGGAMYRIPVKSAGKRPAARTLPSVRSSVPREILARKIYTRAIQR